MDNTKMLLPVVGIVAIAALGFYMLRPTQSADQSSDMAASPAAVMEAGSSPATSDMVDQQVTDEMAQTSEFQDGTYTAVGNYTSPGGQEELGVTLTLADGVVVDSQVEVKATRPISVTRQEDFAANYKEAVIGKNIADLELGKISGSSLSPKGFNDAVAKIKEQAQS